jgi:hypothetical protein
MCCESLQIMLGYHDRLLHHACIHRSVNCTSVMHKFTTGAAMHVARLATGPTILAHLLALACVHAFDAACVLTHECSIASHRSNRSIDRGDRRQDQRWFLQHALLRGRHSVWPSFTASCSRVPRSALLMTPHPSRATWLARRTTPHRECTATSPR